MLEVRHGLDGPRHVGISVIRKTLWWFRRLKTAADFEKAYRQLEAQVKRAERLMESAKFRIEHVQELQASNAKLWAERNAAVEGGWAAVKSLYDNEQSKKAQRLASKVDRCLHLLEWSSKAMEGINSLDAKDLQSRIAKELARERDR